jgi:hypothetical protein
LVCASSLNEKSPEATRASGLARFGYNRSRPLTLGVPNNNHDIYDTDASGSQKIRAVGSLGHGRKPVYFK